MKRPKHMLLELVPPPRRPVAWSAAMPLAGFVAAYLALWFVLELGGYIRFTTHWPLALLVVTPWIWWLWAAGYSGLRGWRATAALLVRLAVVGVFIMVLAEPRAVRKSDVLSVVYTLDVSDSIGEGTTDKALGFILDSLGGKPERDEAGLVVFGRNASVELPPRITFPFEAINSQIQKDATDLEQGISLAGAMVPEGNNGRIVLISDGVDTEGDPSSKVLDQLKARGIPVDVLPISYHHRHEVWLERIDLPRFVRAGETYEAAIILNSLQAGNGTLTLRENGEVIHQGAVEFSAGKNRYALPLYLRQPGFYEYVATLSTPEGMDGWPDNNTAIGYIYLKGEGRLLLVYDPEGRPDDWRPLADALKAAENVVEPRVPFEFPRDAFSLMPYDAVIFCNVGADEFDMVQMTALKDAVHAQGSGFVMIGGQNSFGPGGYHRTPIEAALPVTMDIKQRKVLPKGALVIILHTCEFDQGNTWAERIAKRAISVLGERDEVGVLAFGPKGEDWIFKLTPAGEKEKLFRVINMAAPTIGDMPSFVPTMQMGLTALQNNDAASKHMIIISDGDPARPSPALLQQFVAAGVSISTVAINPHVGTTTDTLKLIAGATGGKFYYPSDPRQLPGIFIKEARTLKRSLIQNKTFTPVQAFPSQIMKGINALPALQGLVLTSARPQANVVLLDDESEDKDPVLATWRHGVGKTAAFTSGLGTNWAKRWVVWDRYKPFVKQLIEDIRRTTQKTNLHMRTLTEGGNGMIFVEDFAGTDDEAPAGADAPEAGFLDVRAEINGPRDRKLALPLKQVGPRRYRGSFPLWGKGRYQVSLLGQGAGRRERSTGGFVVPYSPEYLRFRSDPILLKRIAERTGGRVLNGNETAEEIFLPDREPKESTRSVVDLFLLLLAVLIPLDVGVRRVQLDWRVIAGWFGIGRTREESTETLGALLKRKQQIGRAEQERKESRPTEALRRKAAQRRTERKEAPRKTVSRRPEPEEKPAEDEGLSTTERLLRMKKKWKEDE